MLTTFVIPGNIKVPKGGQTKMKEKKIWSIYVSGSFLDFYEKESTAKQNASKLKKMYPTHQIEIFETVLTD